MATLTETTTAPETLSTKYLTEGFMRGGKLVERKRVKYDVVKVTSYASVPTARGSVNDEAVNVGYLNTKNTALKNELTTSINAVKSTADKNKSDITSMNTTITNINNTLSSLNTTIQNMNTTLTAVKDKVDGLVDGNNTAY